jgi:RNAse (barnase) inhibitor barstar
MKTFPLNLVNLEDARAAGILHVPETTFEAIGAAAENSGFACIRVDLGTCPHKDSVLARLADAFAFPAWFGQNWDALADCLADMSWLPARGYAVMLDRLPPSEADAQNLLSILADATRAWADIGTPMWIFIATSNVEWNDTAEQ